MSHQAPERDGKPGWSGAGLLLTSVAIWIYLGALPPGPALAATATGSASATVIAPVPVSVQDVFGGVPATISTSTGWVTVLLPPATPPPPQTATGSGTSKGAGGGGSGAGSTTAVTAGSLGAPQSGRPGSGPGSGDGTLGSGMAASLSSAPPPAGGTSGNYNVTVAFN